MHKRAGEGDSAVPCPSSSQLPIAASFPRLKPPYRHTAAAQVPTRAESRAAVGAVGGVFPPLPQPLSGVCGAYP